MDHPNQEGDYHSVVETLMNMFGNVVSRDVVNMIVDCYDGNLLESVNAVMKISNDSNKSSNDSNKSTNDSNQSTNDSNQSTNEEDQTVAQSALSYANVSQNTGAIPKKIEKPINTPPKITNTSPKMYCWTKQVEEIKCNHKKGYRILIIMRGVPGSGKSYLARQIIEVTIGSKNDYSKYVYSTDDFFMRGTNYVYNRNQLSEAHTWNQKRVEKSMNDGISPIVVDNTNIELWEMEPYVRAGVRNGYLIEVVEPNTPWARKPHILLKKNTHNVALATIRRMLDNYQNSLTGNLIISYYNLSYPLDMVPPVLRKFPPILSNTNSISTNEDNQNTENSIKTLNVLTEESEPFDKNSLNQVVDVSTNLRNLTVSKDTADSKNLIDLDDISQNIVVEKTSENLEVTEGTEQTTVKCEDLAQVEKYFEEYQKVEQAWENSENWEDRNTLVLNDILNMKCEEKTKAETTHEKLLTSLNKCNDWTELSMFMSPWNNDPLPNVEKSSDIIVETVSSGTCMEIGDIDMSNIKNNYKVISATPRDINLFYTPLEVYKAKIPEKLMLDKSSMTNEQLIMESYECKNKEQHFVTFRKLFKNISKADLRDIFDKCGGDVNWAVEIVFDGMVNNKLVAADSEDLSDTEDLILEQCDCLAAYNIIPDRHNILSEVENKIQKYIPNINTDSKPQRKGKKDKMLSDTHIEIKHQIEQNVTIPDNHYSEHCLKIKKMRHGDQDVNGDNIEQASSSTSTENAQVVSKDEAVLSTIEDNNSQGAKNAEKSDEELSSCSSEDTEKIVQVNLGLHFISQLDELFGRKDTKYPKNIIPKTSIPLSLLKELDALWMESLMHQLEEEKKQSAVMLQQDEDFARQLAIKEAELVQTGEEPRVPNFKEIMDMDFALSLYYKDVAEWRNNEPNDLATRMTKEKLYNLFPDVSHDILSELLMAHDNNFQATVEVLLNSTGQEHILQEENGLNKYLFQKEMERQKKILEEQKKAISEIEWPLLPKEQNVDMAEVEAYREDADQHLEQRNQYIKKASDYMLRGMPQAANYYSEVAEFHKKKYEQANSRAAATLIQVHALKCRHNATVDLHYLRVSEAKESLDLFVDVHIKKLRELEITGGSKFHVLYFITGRGLHSNGKSRLKPAIRNRLRERGLRYKECNPGLLSAKVYAANKLTCEIL